MDSVLFVEKSSKRVVIGGTKAKLQLPSLHTQDVVIVSEALDNRQVLVFPETLFKEKFEPWEEHAFNHPKEIVGEAAYAFWRFAICGSDSSPLYLQLYYDGDKLKNLLVEYGVPSTWKITWCLDDYVSPRGYTRQVSATMKIEKA